MKDLTCVRFESEKRIVKSERQLYTLDNLTKEDVNVLFKRYFEWSNEYQVWSNVNGGFLITMS